MRYFIKTFGCQMNHSDSERIAGFLETQPHHNPLLTKEREFKAAESINEADLVIFNTCGVRQSAEDRVYGQIHNLRKKNPNLKIIVTGCLANRKDVQRRLRNKVNLFFSINEFEKFENWIIENCLKIENLKFKISAQSSDKNCFNYLSLIPKHTKHYQAYVPIMTGCNNFCSYCVVPYARGREVSRPTEEIINEIKNLVRNGCKEIVLLGQNVNSYSDNVAESDSGTESDSVGFKRINFSKLLKLIEKIPGKFWISFVSSHPKDYSDELIETIVKSKKVCEYIHLPLQAGDDKILERMNRKYTQKHYLTLIKKIKSSFKKHKPNTLYSITSDIIVGFPGETKKQFLESAKVMGKVGYDMVYFGQFSPRPRTAAWDMKDNVSKKEKERREKFLNEILKKTTSANNKKYVGKVMEVLIDKTENKGLGHLMSKDLNRITYYGRTRTMKNIKINLTPTLSLSRRGRIMDKENLIGKLVKVKITKANFWNLEGEIL